MFNLKYNCLVIINIIFGILNTVLLIKLFGVSAYSDAYLLSLSIFEVMCLVLLMPISQFMPYYNELKNKSVKKSQDFYNCSLIFAFFIGILMCLTANILLKPIISIFTMNIDPQRYEILKGLVFIQTLGLMFYPVNGVNERLLNAEMKFSIPYTLVILPTAAVVSIQCWMLLTNNINVYYLAYARTLGLFCISLFGTTYIAKYLIRFKFVKWQSIMPAYIKNSAIIQFGSNFWSITIPIIFNNFLVSFPQGFVSYFYYARKILDIVNSFTIGPSRNILCSKISYLLPRHDIENIKKISRKFLILGGLVFIIAIIIAYFVQSPILNLITSNKLTAEELKQIALLFLALSPWYFIIFCETPFVCINVQAKKAKSLLFINVLFTVVFAILLSLFKIFLGFYALAFATAAAQIFNLICHRFVALSVIKRI